MDVAARVLAMRTARGMTQQQLASAAGISLATLSMIERGRNRPRIGTLRRIAAALSCDPADLLSEIRELSADEAEVVAIMRRVPEDQRQILVRQARVFDGAMTAAV